MGPHLAVQFYTRADGARERQQPTEAKPADRA
jgi:hypothetical protein